MTSSFTKAMLDEIALNKNGMVGNLPDIPQAMYGYEFVRIHTKGRSNKGDVVLVATSPATAALLKRGKIKMLCALGVHSNIAEAVYSKLKTIRHGLEPRVLEFALTNHQCGLEVPAQVTSNRQFWDWFNRTGLSDQGLSAQRLAAAFKIIKALT